MRDICIAFCFQEEYAIQNAQESRWLEDVYKSQDPADQIGTVADAAPDTVAAAHAAARLWDAPAARRAVILRRAADLYENHAGELFALCAREAGKSLALSRIHFWRCR